MAPGVACVRLTTTGRPGIALMLALWSARRASSITLSPIGMSGSAATVPKLCRQFQGVQGKAEQPSDLTPLWLRYGLKVLTKRNQH